MQLAVHALCDDTQTVTEAQQDEWISLQRNFTTHVDCFDVFCQQARLRAFVIAQLRQQLIQQLQLQEQQFNTKDGQVKLVLTVTMRGPGERLSEVRMAVTSSGE